MKTKRKVMWGEVYYIKTFPTSGHEQKSGRPAVIVSNNENNAHAGTYEICYMTLQEKSKLPTHIFIDRGPCINSTILCEQITTITEEKLGDFMCRIPEHLEYSLRKALAVSLGIESLNKTPCSPSLRGNEAYHMTPKVVMDELTELKHCAKILGDELNVAKDANATLKMNLLESKAKAEMYERMYNDLLDRLVKKG